jgi:radical SAM superfamily enzyme YgiQ (UPF0313 family)
MYREKVFRIREFRRIKADIAEAAADANPHARVFLCDGDALAIPHAELVAILDEIRLRLPGVVRVATYANAKSIARKTNEQLAELRSKNLKLFHMGLESGDDVTLRRMEKHGDARFQVEQGRRAAAAGVKLFVSVLLGLGGRDRSREHASATAQALSEMNPDWVGALSLILVPGTPLHDDAKAGRFELPPPRELLVELRTIVEQTSMHGMFYANHASNYLPLRARLPRDRSDALALIDAALQGQVRLKPEWMRGV